MSVILALGRERREWWYLVSTSLTESLDSRFSERCCLKIIRWGRLLRKAINNDLWVHVHVHLYTYICTHIYKHTHTIYTYTCTHIHTCTHIYKHTHTIYTYTHRHTHMHTHVHRHMKPPKSAGLCYGYKCVWVGARLQNDITLIRKVRNTVLLKSAWRGAVRV